MRWKPICVLLVAWALAAQAAAPQSPAVPKVDPSSDEQIDLLFSEPVSVRDIYRELGKAWGFNVQFDRRLKDQELAIELTGVTAREGFSSILRAVGHFYTVVGPNAILIADDTPQNRRTYEHQVIQKFYLENAELTDMMTLVRTLIGAKHIAADESSNTLSIRDTADKVALVEEIVRRHDRPRAEVEIGVHLLAVHPEALRELGLRDSSGTVPGGDDVPARLAAGEIDRLLQHDSTRSLTQSAIDVIAGSKGELRLMDRHPVPVASGPDAAHQYQEVGLSVEIVPRVHSAEEATFEVRVSAGALLERNAGNSDDGRPVFGQHELKSSIRMRHGETYLLIGVMIPPEDTKADSRYLGRFLREAVDGREVVLALTPRIVRGPSLVEGDSEPIWIGTESNIDANHVDDVRASSPIPSPFGQASGRTHPKASGQGATLDEAEREKVRKRSRERLRTLEREEADRTP